MSQDSDEEREASGGQRRIPAPRCMPGPLRELKVLLYRLYLEARTPPVARIASLIADDPDDLLPGCPSKDTVHRIIGSTEFPAQQANVVSIAAVLAREAGWDVTDAVERVRSAWVTANLTQPPGKPLGELDPHSLEVHHSITVQASDSAPLLPIYVVRDHDHLVRKVVDQAVAGKSAFITLVGESSTGKTRSLWEAIQRLPTHWRLWQALDSASPADLAADLEQIGPHTVVWLNEAQRFLLTANPREGEQNAAALRRIMHTQERSPVLILATLWPKYWEQLTTAPRDGLIDLRPHARHALDGSAISVPVAFEADDLKQLKEAGARDPRLAQAAERSEQNQVTQYLAGVPALIARYRTASPQVRALINAAMDIRRLGHGEHIPLELLEAAAYEYLTDLEFDLLPEDWLESALALVAEPQRGIRGPLTRIRPRNKEAAGGPVRYRLADPLDQLAREERRHLSPPSGLWGLLIRHSTPSDSLSIGESAEARGLYRIAATLYKKCSDSGAAEGAIAIGEMLSMTARWREVVEWYEKGYSLGNPKGLRFAAETMAEQDSPDWGRIKSHYMRSALQGDLFALHACREVMFNWEYEGDREEWFKDAVAEFFDNVTMESALSWCEKYGLVHDLGRLLLISGEESRALAILEKSAYAGNFMSLFEVCDMKQESEGVDAVISYLVGLSRTDGMIRHFAPMQLRRLLTSEGRTEECITRLQELCAEGNRSAAQEFAEMLRQQDRTQDAIAFLRSVEGSENDVSRVLADLLKHDSSADEAIALLTPLATAGQSGAQHELAKILEGKQRVDEAIAWYQKSAEDGTYDSAHGATRLLIRAGRSSEAYSWLRSICNPDGHHQRIECAEWALKSMGRDEEANRVKNYGWEPDGSVSTPWFITPSPG